MDRILFSTWLIFTTVASTVPCFAQDAPLSSLSQGDRILLLGLIGDPLTDPVGRQYCTVTIVARTCWGSSGEVEIGAWFQPASDAVSARVYFTDNDWIAAPKEFKPRDFVAESRALLESTAEKDSNDNVDNVRRRMEAISAAGTPGIVRAAWLAKLGHEDLAARTFAKVKIDTAEISPTNVKLVESLRNDLAWMAYADAVHAYMERADEESLRHAMRLNDKYPEFAAEFGNGNALVDELRRRKGNKTFGEAAPEKPVDFDQWEKRKQVLWLIGQLDQVDARQWSQPGGVDLADDWRVDGLIAIGDPAVDELIDTIEKDLRLMRSVHFWRDFARHRTVLSVREAALTAVMSILKVRVFEPSATGDNFTSRGDDKVESTVASLRRYWEKHRDTPFENRMMDVLTNPASNQESLREAAKNLSQIGRKRTLSTTVFTDSIDGSNDDASPNPAIKKFVNPTAAEAILAALDRDLAQHDGQEENDHSGDYERRRIEAVYLQSITDLGDNRIVGRLRQRCDSAMMLRMRRQLVLAIYELGDAEPLNAFANEFRDGTIVLSASDSKSNDSDEHSEMMELEELVRMLGTANTPAADAALVALTDPKHPYHTIARLGIHKRYAKSPWIDEAGWFIHPYCIAFLRRDLDDKTPTGTVAMIDENEQYVEKNNGGESWSNIPEIIADPASRRPKAELRRCDIVAQKLTELVIGLPPYHPLMRYVDARLDSIRTLLDRKPGLLRRATTEECEQHDRRWGPVYVLE